MIPVCACVRVRACVSSEVLLSKPLDRNPEVYQDSPCLCAPAAAWKRGRNWLERSSSVRFGSRWVLQNFPELQQGQRVAHREGRVRAPPDFQAMGNSCLLTLCVKTGAVASFTKKCAQNLTFSAEVQIEPRTSRTRDRKAIPSLRCFSTTLSQKEKRRTLRGTWPGSVRTQTGSGSGFG